MESFSWGSGSGRDVEDWEKQSDVSPGNTRHNSRVKRGHDEGHAIMRKNGTDDYGGHASRIYTGEEQLAEMKKLML